MKSKTNQFETARFRRDYFFSALVRVFGFLVLATFATLLLHILSNALPLLQSPSSEKTHSVETKFAASSIGSMQLQGEWIDVSAANCAVFLTRISANNAQGPSYEVVKKFALECSKQILGLAGDRNQHLLILNSNNVLEIYFLTNTDTLTLKTSLTLPVEFSPQTIATWKTTLSNNTLFLQRDERTSQGTSIITLTHELSSLEAPIVNQYDDSQYLLPVIKFGQVLVASKHELVIYNDKQQALQSWSVDQSEYQIQDVKEAQQSPHNRAFISGLFISPSSLDIFVRISLPKLVDELGVDAPRVWLKKFTLVNHQGDFLLREIFSQAMLPNFDDGGLHAAFDLRHNAAIFVTQGGSLKIMNVVTGEIKLSTVLATNIRNIYYAQGQLQVTYVDTLERYQLDNMQGMTSMQILFGKNNYAGYSQAEYLWQTSVSSETQAPKYSVIPLVMGSLKASILALFVALPLALGAAIYTAYFAAPHIRNAVKPSIEMLEAIPSVIIGFIAAVWLAPFAEQYLMSIFAVIISLPFVVLAIGAIHGFVHNKVGGKRLDNWQLPINAMLLLLAVVTIFVGSLFISDYATQAGQNSLLEAVSHISLSKTAIVVALALGVAIAPTIYTLIDDALFEVPEGVKQASFALGATQIQTLVKVVLVVAFPSIVSAVMLGFGRAFGETMIVLMVTGNTPIANWDLLSGLRTLTSNLAIELQEAQVDSTPYHILFLTAAILFAFTFVVNTIAALLKRRMHHDGQ